MEKHIGIYKGENDVLEALKNQELFYPYLIWCEDFGQVMNTPWEYVRVRINDSDFDNISVGSGNQYIGLSISCNDSMYYQLTFPSELTLEGIPASGYTQYDNGALILGANETGEDRVVEFDITFSEEEHGDTTYARHFTINQPAVVYPEIGWLVDGNITTDNQFVPYTGGNVTIAIINVGSWEVRDNNDNVLDSGVGDSEVLVSVASSTTTNNTSMQYSVLYYDLEGNYLASYLGLVLQGVQPPEIDLDALWFDTQEGRQPVPYYSYDTTAITISTSTMGESDSYKIDVSTGSTYVTVTSGTGNFEVEIPVVSNTGTTVTKINGSQSGYGMIRVLTTAHGLTFSTTYTPYLLPNNVIAFNRNNPTSTTANISFNDAETIGVVVFTNEDSVTGVTLTSQSSAYTGEWTYEETEIEIGELIEIVPTINMEQEEIFVDLGIELSQENLTFSVIQGQYKDPSRASLASYCIYSIDDTFVLLYNRSTVVLRVSNLLPTDTVLYSDTQGHYYEYTDIKTFNRSIHTGINQTGAIRQIGDFNVEVVRDGDTFNVFDWYIYQDCTTKPELIYPDTPDSTSIEFDSGAQSIELVSLVSGTMALTGVTVPSGWTATTDGNNFTLDIPANETGSDIDEIITANYVDNDSNTYTASFEIIQFA